MTQLIELSTGQNLTLTKQIARSGEGCVWRTSRDGFLAKVYHQPTAERIKKLEVMVVNPPEDKLAHLPHVSYAWPLSILMDQQRQKVGFLMPEIKLGRQLTEIYNPKLRKTHKLEIDWQFLHATAYNIALFMESIHKAGYVIGDVKPENILVNPQALPSIIDTDSFQVRDRDGTVYRCPVGSEGFTPPELVGKNFTEIDQDEVHDRFRLAVMIFTLLFGYEPFKGVWKGGGDPPPPPDWVKYGYWAYGTSGKVGLADYMIPLEVVHPDLKELFLRCFNDGFSVPSMRPTAREWKQVLAIANRELRQCSSVSSHYYHREHQSCYWCERKAKGFPDVFESQGNRQVAQKPSSQNKRSSTKTTNKIGSNQNPQINTPAPSPQKAAQSIPTPVQSATVTQSTTNNSTRSSQNVIQSISQPAQGGTSIQITSQTASNGSTTSFQSTAQPSAPSAQTVTTPQITDSLWGKFLAVMIIGLSVGIFGYFRSLTPTVTSTTTKTDNPTPVPTPTTTPTDYFGNERLMPVSCSNGLWGYATPDGKVTIPPQFDYARSFEESLAQVNVGGKFGFIDKSGEMVTPPQFDIAKGFEEGLAQVQVGDKWGFIDQSGKIVIPTQFDYTWSFNEGLVQVYMGGKWGFIDKAGEIVIPTQFDNAKSFEEGLAPVKVGDKWGFIDKSGKMVIALQFDYTWGFDEGLAPVLVGHKIGFIDKSGEMVIPPQFDVVLGFDEGLASVNIGDKWGFIDKSGKMVIPPQFDYTWGFDEGLASVKVGDRWGFIDKSGKMVIPPQFVNTGVFYEGLASVMVGDRWGFIDKSGKMVIPPQFDSPLLLFFKEGLAQVQVGGKWGFVDKSGKIILPEC